MSINHVASKARQAVDELLVIGKERVELVNFPLSLQFDSYTCGTRCVDMVLRYYFNLRVPLKELKQQCNTTREDGTPTEDLLECLKSYGLLPVHRRKHAGMNDAIRSAIDMGHPVLAVVPTRDPDTEHWVVIHGYTLHPRTFLYRDPRPGFFKISRIKEYVVVGPKTKSAKSAAVQKK